MRLKRQIFFTGFLEGAGISFIILLIAFVVILFIQNNKLKQIEEELRKKERQIASTAAPYYDPSVFQPPGDLIKKTAEEIKIPIIMYHYVEYVQDPGDTIRKSLNVTPLVFEQQLYNLKTSGWENYFVKDIPDILTGKVNYSSQSAVLSFDDGYEDFYTNVFPLLKKYHIRATLYIVNHFIGRKGFLNAKQIKEMIASNLVEIGSHTLDHANIKYAEKSVVEHQIIESKKELEDQFGIEVKTFAYPFGGFNQQTIDIVKEASFSAAVSVIPGTLQSEENKYYLYRLRPGFFYGKDITKVLEKYQK
jgi:peptidoglycan/xylan/chitin deacetylase (PgdA/CDA1 family)